MKTEDRVALDLQGGAAIVLQRVPRTTEARSFAAALSEITGQDVSTVANPCATAPGVRLFDARSLPDTAFDSWDSMRPQLATEASTLVVLLNASRARALLDRAPHVASWAGGIAMPTHPQVRYAETSDERSVGAKLLRQRLAEQGLAEHAVGVSVGVDIASGRLFFPEGDDNALAVARRSLDEGILHVERLPRPPR